MQEQNKEYKTLLDVVEEILDGKDNMEFAKLFDMTQKILFPRWRNETDPNISDDAILLRKRGELYRLLTVDGRFFHNIDGTWTTKRPEFIKN
ncbi:DNA-directed RNA polymerase subunit delta [Metamycoplasma alkalescens]|uniref:Uncharacterized protein n=3 Tax=Metamycoplasma alkalescens TaxID=45363 RepID=N9UAL2_9BACT|nr:hypothetical protein [Metamycoplasma alkalescens]ENY53968.1 Hypothetical protein MALK_3110 [Metamycoplasma alkalescens 14918]PYF42672.1 hypothetical protein BCF88_10750 [Metamycoplasma alkalescens]